MYGTGDSIPETPPQGRVEPEITWVNNSGMGNLYPLPDGVAGWSWGGFTLTWIWAVANRSWVGLFALVPFIGFIMRFVIGAKGREWAWRNRRWDSVEHFNRVQRRWSIWGGVLFVVPTTGIIAAVGLPAYQEYTVRTHVTNAVDYANDAANAVGRYLGASHALPQDLPTAGIDAPLPPGVASVELDRETGRIRVAMEVGNLHGNAFYVVPSRDADGATTWNCVRGEIPARLMPPRCRFDTAPQ